MEQNNYSCCVNVNLQPVSCINSSTFGIFDRVEFVEPMLYSFLDPDLDTVKCLAHVQRSESKSARKPNH